MRFEFDNFSVNFQTLDFFKLNKLSSHPITIELEMYSWSGNIIVELQNLRRHNVALKLVTMTRDSVPSTSDAATVSDRLFTGSSFVSIHLPVFFGHPLRTPPEIHPLCERLRSVYEHWIATAIGPYRGSEGAWREKKKTIIQFTISVVSIAFSASGGFS